MSVKFLENLYQSVYPLNVVFVRVVTGVQVDTDKASPRELNAFVLVVILFFAWLGGISQDGAVFLPRISRVVLVTIFHWSSTPPCT